ncbi:hypothetical protein ELE36_14235 [Pseudolysobacter antarcticus]|uniref:Uncharacterized protein n=1 Tax=Pseudolysobacter antarcticus TaxID=2511995 RepID=A0A411HM01_9GAMM|nr:hypothetical protein [Pseudolysobacter antarcticus]QBB71420.1 hypothetical protein ELE36_14235 [Pseudolysobacter antarcticus]
MSGQSVCILSPAGGSTPLCLSVNVYDNATIIVDNFYDDPSLGWLSWTLFDLGDGSVALWHTDYAAKLVASADGSLSLRPGDMSNTQSYADDERWTIVRADTSPGMWGFIKNFITDPTRGYTAGLAIRPALNSDRNLNILGNGPYNPGSVVAAWDGWGNGEPNEVWAVVPFPTATAAEVQPVADAAE